LGWSFAEWSRFGYIAITLLPPLGIHMLATIAGKKRKFLLLFAYGACAAFIVFYLLNPASINGQACYPNYAVFYTNHDVSMWYTAYYYGWLLIGTYMALHWGIEQPAKRKTLHYMMLGYLVFLVPTTAFNIIDPTSIKAIPSVMCGFAVLLAFVLVFKVLPNSCQPRRDLKK
jgi:hypothetical protein